MQIDDVFMGEVRLFAMDYAPRGWARCDGQLLSIIQNAALFSLLGTTYGGDGTKTFGLPDMRGRAMVGTGQNAVSNQNFPAGAHSGAERTMITASQMPAHNHIWQVNNGPAKFAPPAGRYLAAAGAAGKAIALYGPGAPDVTLMAMGSAGLTQSYDNMQPFLVLTYCICLNGEFPSRD